jgi:hypothetical protein
MSCHSSSRHAHTRMPSVTQTAPWFNSALASTETASTHLLVLDRFLLECGHVLRPCVVFAGLAPRLLLASQLYCNQLLFQVFALAQTGLQRRAQLLLAPKRCLRPSVACLRNSNALSLVRVSGPTMGCPCPCALACSLSRTPPVHALCSVDETARANLSDLEGLEGTVQAAQSGVARVQRDCG